MMSVEQIRKFVQENKNNCRFSDEPMHRKTIQQAIQPSRQIEQALNERFEELRDIILKQNETIIHLRNINDALLEKNKEFENRLKQLEMNNNPQL